MLDLNSVFTVKYFLNSFKFYKNLSKCFNATFLFQNYFWLFTIGTVVLILTQKGYIISILFPLVIYYLAFIRKSKKIKYDAIDILWWIYLLINVQTWLFNDYAYKPQLIGRFFMAQGAYMVAYWIGRKSEYDNLKKITEKSIVPLTITCLLGIYFYLFQPAWYMNMLYRQFLDAGQQAFQEFARLRSIFASPYVLAYFCSFTMSWVWFELFGQKQISYKVYMFIGLLFCTSMLAMMRAPWGCAMLSLCIAILYTTIYGKNKKSLKRIIPFALVLVLAVSYAFAKMNSEDLAYLMDKIGTISSKQGDLLSERINLYDIRPTLLGDGAGRHAFYVDEYPPNYQLPDGEYQKMQMEIGYVGMSCVCLMFGLGILKAIRHFKHLYFELCILLTCIITMMGASSLMVVNEHPFIFWLALGQVSKFKK